MWHAWYSAKQSQRTGTKIYLSEDGRTEIEVSEVVLIGHGDKPFGHFDDFEYRGKVVKWLRQGISARVNSR